MAWRVQNLKGRVGGCTSRWGPPKVVTFGLSRFYPHFLMDPRMIQSYLPRKWDSGMILGITLSDSDWIHRVCTGIDQNTWGCLWINRWFKQDDLTLSQIPNMWVFLNSGYSKAFPFPQTNKSVLVWFGGLSMFGKLQFWARYNVRPPVFWFKNQWILYPHMLHA